MKTRVRASMTVEISMLFPIVFLLIMAVLQCALYLVYEIYAKALCDKGAILGQYWYTQGETAETCTEKVKAYMTEQLQNNPLRNPQAHAEIEETLFRKTISLAVESEYTLLFPMQVDAVTFGNLVKPASYKETMDLIWEAAALLPPVHELLAAYEDKLEAWKGRISSGE